MTQWYEDQAADLVVDNLLLNSELINRLIYIAESIFKLLQTVTIITN